MKIASLKAFSENGERLISDTVRIDGDADDIVRQCKGEFYKE